MSKKWIVSLVSIGIVIAVVLILFWTLFALSSVTVDFQSTFLDLNVPAEEIVEAGEFHKGACVLFEGKKRSVQKIYDKARENPNFAYIRVVNIETVFPNKFVVHVAEREELFAVKNFGQALICDRDLRVLNILDESEFDALIQKPILLDGLEIENEEVFIGDFLKTETDFVKGFYSAFLQNNRSFGEIVGKFERAEISKYVEDVTNKEFSALTLFTREGQEFVIKNPDFAFANKVALMYAVESALFSQQVDENGNILDTDGQPIYLVKNAKGQYVLADSAEDLEDFGGSGQGESENQQVALSFELLKNCQIVIDNLTLDENVKVGETDLYFYLQEKL